MSDPAITAALWKAHKAASSFYTESDTALIVIAFHELLEKSYPGRLWTSTEIADAVERAARDGGDARGRGLCQARFRTR